MKIKRTILPVLLTAGVALTASSAIVSAEVNPFVSQELIAGYQVAEANAGLKAEGRCGEAKCGANAADKLEKGDKVTSNPDKTFKAEGRCGEGKCGANALDKAEISDSPGDTDVAPSLGNAR